MITLEKCQSIEECIEHVQENIINCDIKDVFLLANACNLLTDNAYDELDFDGQEWVLCTYEEAEKRAKDYILDSVWAFNASFLASHSGIDSDIIAAVQAKDKCESNNDMLLRLIKDKGHFVNDAIGCDGLGHFLNTYDGECQELGNDKSGVYWVAYRTN
jgi:hypothetical protein